MNPDKLSRRTLAFTLVELLTVIAIIGVLAALLMPVLNKSELRTKRIVCINDLQQIGLAFHTFANDHSGKFPMAVSTNEGGSMEYVQSGFDDGGTFYTTFYHFQALSNELVFPRILNCPADMARAAATNFPALQNENVSYFVGVDATFDKPGSILAGDRNLVTNAFQQPTILQIGPRSDLGWTWELHQYKGNVLFSDGHVEEWNNSSLATAAGESSANESLFLPSVMSAPNMPSGGFAGSGSVSSPPSSANPNSPSQMETGQSDSNPGPQAQPGVSPQSSPSRQPLNASSVERLDKMEAASQSEPPPMTIEAGPATSANAGTNGTTGDTNAVSGMSVTNRHLTKLFQHLFEWFYLLMCLLMLLYLLYKIRQWVREREERQRALLLRRKSFADADDSFR